MNILSELTEYINTKTVVEFEELKMRFPGRSESSFRRDLSKLKCLTSFTDNSKYYTLPDIPNYDGFGLWQYGDIGFSKHGTIKETARVLIDESARGLSHTDLNKIIGVPLYNPLRALVKEGSVICETDGYRMMFYSAEDEINKRQRNNSTGTACADHPFDLHVTIDLLLAVFLEKEDTVEKAYIFLKRISIRPLSKKKLRRYLNITSSLKKKN